MGLKFGGEHYVAQTTLRGALFAAVWFMLAGTDPTSWLIGGPTIAVAVLVSMKTSPVPWRLPRLSALLRLVAHFMVHSIRAGFDVARRALSPSLPLRPDLVDVETGLPSPGRRQLKAGIINLLPGTLTVLDEPGRDLVVHVLDRRSPTAADARRIERRLADLAPTVREQGR